MNNVTVKIKREEIGIGSLWQYNQSTESQIFMLVEVHPYTVVLIDLENGARYKNPTKVDNIENLSGGEWEDVVNLAKYFTRVYDVHIQTERGD